MLRHISVRNIALIRELELDFFRGLSVLTGETGAGKSLIVDSLSFILGAKADKTLISHGVEKASVEALFDVNERSAKRFIEAGYPCENNEVLIARTLTAEGRSDIRINGKIATLSVLKAFTAELTDIHGQHEHQSLLRPETHIELLDAFDDDSIEKAKEPLTHLTKEFQEIKRQLKSIGGSEAERARAEDLLKYQIQEIENAAISETEETDLEQKYFRANNAEKLKEGLSAALRYLNGNGDYLNDLAHAQPAIAGLSRFDERFEGLAARVGSAYLELDDIHQELTAYLDENAAESFDIDSLITRTEEYKRLKRKYGSTVKDVLAYLDGAKKNYEELINCAEIREKLHDRQLQIMKEYCEKSALLTAARQNAALVLERAVLKELSDLGMNGSRFECRFQPIDDDEPHSNGSDHVEFYLSTNKGEPPKPLTKVISGGEMSRFMLALKVIAAKADGIDTIVFDEIDTGISGKVGEAIAQKLAKLSRSHQILCISHLPTIAAMADHHYLIEKKVEGEKTVTTVGYLNRDGMINEISRLVGGSDVGNHSRLHSEELKDWCDHFKLSTGC